MEPTNEHAERRNTAEGSKSGRLMKSSAWPHASPPTVVVRSCDDADSPPPSFDSSPVESEGERAEEPLPSGTTLPVCTSVLAWIDIEGTTSDRTRAEMLEFALIITTSDVLAVRATMEEVVHHDEGVLKRLSAWSEEHHARVARWRRTSLLQDCLAGGSTLEDIDERATALVDRFLPAGTLMMLCGSNLRYDQALIERCLPRLAARLHYKYLDVSSLLHAARLWAPTVRDGQPRPSTTHRALDDAKSSLKLMRYYRHSLMRAPDAFWRAFNRRRQGVPESSEAADPVDLDGEDEPTPWSFSNTTNSSDAVVIVPSALASRRALRAESNPWRPAEAQSDVPVPSL